jgi:methyl-accepting chemotaxis protein
MQWIRNLKLMSQIMSMVLLGIFFLVVIGFAGFYFNQQAKTQMKEVYYERLLPIDWLQEARANIRAIEGNLLALAIAPDQVTRDNLRDELAQRSKVVDEKISSFEKTDLNQFEKDNLASVHQKMTILKASRKEFTDLVLAGKPLEAMQVYNIKIADQVDGVQNDLRTIVNYHEKRAQEVNEENERNAVIASSIIGGVSLLALIILACFGFWLARSIAGPMGSVTGALVEVANGNLTIRDINITTTNEVGKLAKALNTMKDNMTALVRQIQNDAEQVAASSEELTASSEQSAQAANQVATSITSVANGATEQLAAANETSAVVQQMSAGVQQMAASANQVAAQSAQAADKATAGGKAVENAVDQMAQIENTVNTSAAVVAKLGERSKEIGQIVDTISGIAGQTNLLALNAAIEAARAGEQGRGFAVVAEEVRKLAEQSQEAAKKIAELIGEIQGDTDKAVVAMSDGTREVKTGAEVVNAAGVAFQEIADLVTQVSGQVKDISAAIQQTAAGSQHIVGSVKKIDELSKKTAGESQSVSAATEEQLASMEEIAASSEALAKLSQGLQTAVAKFRV